MAVGWNLFPNSSHYGWLLIFDIGDDTRGGSKDAGCLRYSLNPKGG